MIGRCCLLLFLLRLVTPLARRRRSKGSSCLSLRVGHSRFLARIPITNRPLSRAVDRSRTLCDDEKQKQTRKSGETDLVSLAWKRLDPLSHINFDDE